MIVLQSGALTAHILSRSATLAGLWLDGHPRSLVLGFSDPLAFATSTFYAGAIVGPIANRVARGQVVIGGHPHQMPQNENAHCLHSGPGGLSDLQWHVSDVTPNSVTLSVDLQERDNGLPGARHICATYAILDTNTLSLTITATSDRDTLMNIAHHPYWTLDDFGDISGHRLQVAATHYVPVDAESIPTGQILPVAGSDYDFRDARLIPVDRTLDANLCVSSARSETPRDIAVLTGRDGITLNIASTEPGLQVYNGSGLPNYGPNALPGQRIAPFCGVALEPQGWPDAPNNPDFPSIFLPHGEEYRQETLYRICNN